MALHSWACYLFSLFILPILHPSFNTQVQAQFAQTYDFVIKQNPVWGPKDQWFWSPDPNTVAPYHIIDLLPTVVYLEYNCYYMRDICKNAENWLALPRGQLRTPNTRFAYDLNTNKQNGRAKQRGKAACPGRWKNSHTCPETDQNIVMRHDGPWPHKALKSGTKINEIQGKRLPNGQTEPSWLRYTCDEFPPKSWVEGGNGLASGFSSAGAAETRCAAFRCNSQKGIKGIKAEQNWQGEAHGKLRGELLRRIDERQALYPTHFPNFNEHDSVIFFYFRTKPNVPGNANGIAAKIYSYSDPALTQLHDPALEVSQAKRNAERHAGMGGYPGSHNMSDPEAYAKFLHWADTVTMDELVAMSNGTVKEHYVFANVTMDDEDVGVMDSGMDRLLWSMSEHDDAASRWQDGEDIEDDKDGDDIHVRTSIFKRRDQNPPRKSRLVFRDTSEPVIAPLLKRATEDDLAKARKVVNDAIATSAKLNRARLANPLRNRYSLRPGTVVGGSSTNRSGMRLTTDADENEDENDNHAPPLLDITDEIAAAAALVSEADAEETSKNRTSSRIQVASSGSYWMEHLDRKGTVPWGDDPDYKVFRNVLDFGAVGDGVTDDTKAINRAMSEPRRCGEKCNGSTTKNAIVYFPPGNYRVSTTIPLPFGTQVIGDANDWPTIVAAPSFIGLGVLSTNEYTGGGIGIDGRDQQWYVNTANFYRQIRNIRIDITQTMDAQEVAGLHYQVAQATSLQNVELIAKPGSSQQGIFAENGSGGVISDVIFRGGKFGLYGGNQQFTAQRLTFDGCTTGVQIIWDWGWIWKSITMTNVGVGFRLLRESHTSSVRRRQTSPIKEDVANIGSASFIDSTFRNVETVVLIAPPSPEPGSASTGVLIENVRFEGVTKAVADTNGKTLLAPQATVIHWALGPVYSPEREYSTGGRIGGFRRDRRLLDAQGDYFERPKPQYEELGVGDFVHLKDLGARGDGVTDDTAALQAALYQSLGRVLFIDAGSYIITGTVTIPAGSKIVGETWSQLVAAGSYFYDAKNPKPMIRVGNPGDVGSVEMQDLIFTNVGATAGLTLVEWNIEASAPGAAALWDCHVRIGGATGTKLTPAECPALTSGIAEGCNAASLMMHITPKASGYFENMWLWVADHMIDDPDLEDANNEMVQNSVYVARGLLVESTKPTWMYGTSSEHAVYYQYNFHNAQSIFAGMIQTESPYFQPTPQPPAPFEDAVGVFVGDPTYDCAVGGDFSGCDESWAVIMRGCRDIFVAGAGLYSWFSTYTQDCIDEHACQKVLMLLENNGANVRIQQLITIGAEYMAVMDGEGIKAIDNLNVESHPRWSQVSVFDVRNSGQGDAASDYIWIDPKIWDQEIPSFTCVPPCQVKLPPWTGVTTTLDFPRVTVSDGAWKTTITRPPIVISKWIFEPVTLLAGGGRRDVERRQQGFEDFWPVLATTPYWPAVTYIDGKGAVKTATPDAPFPTPPPSIGPGAQAPAKGAWPKRAVRPVAGDIDGPLVEQCMFPDWVEGECQNPWDYETYFGDEEEEGGGGGEGDYSDGDDEAEDLVCPEETSTSTTSRPTTTRAPQPDPPKPSPSPMENTVKCYHSGRKEDHVRISYTIKSFCDMVEDRHDAIIRNTVFEPTASELPMMAGQWSSTKIKMRMTVKKGCEWRYSLDECMRYMLVPVNSCNCEGTNGKQGGTVSNNCLEWKIDPNANF